MKPTSVPKELAEEATRTGQCEKWQNSPQGAGKAQREGHLGRPVSRRDEPNLPSHEGGGGTVMEGMAKC